jgi:hypothetical protein
MEANRVDKVVLAYGEGSNRVVVMLHRSSNGRCFYCLEVKDNYVIDSFSVGTLLFRMTEGFYKNWDVFLNQDMVLKKIENSGYNISLLKPTQDELDALKHEGLFLIKGDHLFDGLEESNAIGELLRLRKFDGL